MSSRPRFRFEHAILLIGSIGLAGLLVLLAYWAGPLSFDGGLNFSVAQHFMHTGEYARTYAGTFFFPIETDSVFIFLSALSLKLFGSGIFASQVPNLLFAALLLLMIHRLSRTSLPPGLALASCAVITTAPGFILFAFSGYGECAMLSLLVAAWLLHLSGYRRGGDVRQFIAGIVLGLAITIKIVAAIALPAFVVLPFLLGSRSLRDGARRAGYMLAGATLSYGAWELYRLLAMGFSRWLLWWHYRLGAVLERAGAKSTGALRDTPHLSDKLSKHLELVGGFYDLPPLAVSIMVGVALGGGILLLGMLIKRRLSTAATDERPFQPALVFSAAIGCGYLVWWLALTPTEQAWLRRLLPGLIMLHFALFLCAGLLMRRFISSRSRLVRLGQPLTAALVIALVLGFWLRQHDILNRQQREARAAYAQLVGCIRSLPDDSQLYGVGWYGAPQLSFYAARPFEDLASTPFERIKFGNAYVILDHNALAILGWPEASTWRIFSQFEYKTVVRLPQGAVLRIIGLAPLPAPRPDASPVSQWRRNTIGDELAAGHLRGLANSPSSVRAESLVVGWIYAPSPSSLRLRGTTLPLRLYSNPYSQRHFDDIRFRIRVDGCAEVKFSSKLGQSIAVDRKLTPKGRMSPGPWRKIEIWTSSTAISTPLGGPQNPNQWSWSLDELTVATRPPSAADSSSSLSADF